MGDTWSADFSVRSLEGPCFNHDHDQDRDHDDDDQNYDHDNGCDDGHGDDGDYECNDYVERVHVIKGPQEKRNVCGESHFLCWLSAVW